VLGAWVLLAVVSGCSGEPTTAEPDRVGPSAQPTSAASQPAPVRTQVSIVRATGRLDEAARQHLREQVGAVLDTWIDAAYGGDYPRLDFSAAFDAFTVEAQQRARGDRALLSNAVVGGELDESRAVRRQVRLDVLAVDGTAVGVTARVDLLLELSGAVTRRERVWGSLLLTYERTSGAAKWRVFGYDLRRREA